MPLKKMFSILLGVQFALGLGLILLAYSLFLNEEELSKSQHTHFHSYLLADELRQSSDDLTRMARTYAATGDAEYERQYWTVLDIRNGKRPRPVDYNRIYWDFIGKGNQKIRQDGETIPLRELMKREGFTSGEFNKLSLAQKYSDELVKTERIAMNAVKGIFQDDKGNFTVRKAPDRELAIKLMHDEAYHKMKINIMKPIDEFYIMFDERTSRSVAVYEKRSVDLLHYLAAFLFCIMGTFLFSYFVVQRQIIKCQKMETTLRLSEAQLKAAEQIGKTGGWEYDIALNKGTWTDEMFSIFGRDKAQGHPTFEEAIVYYSPSEGKNLKELIDLIKKTGQEYEYEFMINLSGGKKRVARSKIVPIKDKKGRIIKLQGIVRDISEQKQLEEQILQTRKMETIGTLAGGIAHDFNNMLGIIIGYADITLKLAEKESKISENVRQIKYAARRAAGLTKQLLTFSRKQPAEKTVLSLNMVLAGIKEMLESLMGENIKFELEESPSLKNIYADKSQLEQVIINLVTNSVYAMRDGGKINIRTENVFIDEAAS